MSIDPKVSIIIVSKDRANYLSDALDSLLPQRLHIKEILIFDKSASKHQATTIELLAQKHDAVLYKRSPQLSTASLRNEGIDLASGCYLSFLDDDDVLLPHCIPSQWASLQGSASLVFCNYLTVRYPDHPMRLDDILKRYSYLIRFRRWTAKLAFGQGPLSIENNSFAFISTFIPIIHGAMFKKESLEKIRFSEKMIFCEDMHFWTLFYKNNIQMVFNPQVLAIYRIHDHNLSSNFNSNHNYIFYENIYLEGFIRGKVNTFLLAIKLLRFSRWGADIPQPQRTAIRNQVLTLFYLIPLIGLMMPYFVTLRIQNKLAQRKKVL